MRSPIQAYADEPTSVRGGCYEADILEKQRGSKPQLYGEARFFNPRKSDEGIKPQTHTLFVVSSFKARSEVKTKRESELGTGGKEEGNNTV